MARCREETCGAVIDYATNVDDRTKHMPLDRDIPPSAAAGTPPVEYAVWAGEGGKLFYRKWRPGQELREGERPAVSHFRTCTRPDAFAARRTAKAEKWRRSNPGGRGARPRRPVR